MTSTDGSITEYVCVYGNSGRNLERIYKNLVRLGIPEHYAATIANSRRKYWYISNNKAVIWALNKERLINSGFYDLATAYQSVHINY